MSKSTRRRRKLCNNCGQSFSYSWYREHIAVCMKHVPTSDTCMDDTGHVDNSSEILQDDDATCDENPGYNEAPLSSNSDSTIQDIDDGNSQDLSCQQLPPQIYDQFVRCVEQKRLEGGEQDFFELDEVQEVVGDDSVASESDQTNDQTNTCNPPPTEIWEEAQDDIEQDFNPSTHSSELEGEEKDNLPMSSIEALALWLMLFLASWQSNYSVTDTALVMLIKFLSRFFWLIGTYDNTMASLAHIFPNSHYRLKKALGLLEDDFIKYVVCPKCKSIYKFEDCTETRSGQRVSKKCTFVAWPHHPHRSKRGPCNEHLLKSVRTGSKMLLYPRMVYPYHSLVKSIQNLLKRPGFWEKCQAWRSKNVPNNIKADIHHGNFWKELSNTGFLSSVNSLGLILNVDWFRPHKHSPGSVGVLYLVVADLPREERYKIENVIVAGVLPGPSEPKLTANTFLKPLVEELKSLWQAKVRFSVSGSFLKKPLKVGLICVTCDIPACRKIGGFMGHMANQGCSRCKKEFFKDGCLDFSGFDRSLWPPRTSKEHKEQGKESLQEKTPASQQAFCSRHGARYSVLHELEYFDCIRSFVIDPMHNLYLGTAKHMMKNIWQKEDSPLFSANDFEKMQEIVDSMVTPDDIGRIPQKIAQSCGGFTADQWQSWTIIYSLYALQGILPEKDMKCWQLFVKSCKHLGKKTISSEDIECGDSYMLQFLEEFVRLYGAVRVTPNMHLHAHLKECLYDFGPFHGFWCFSFERYNGILGSYHTNNRSIEIQLMRRFLAQIGTKVYVFPDMFRSEFSEFFYEKKAQGSLKTTVNPIENHLALLRQRTVPVSEIDCADWNDGSHLHMLPPIQDSTLDSDDLHYIRKVYSILLGCSIDILDIPHTIAKFASVKVGDIFYGSVKSRTLRNSYVLANWAGTGGRVSRTNESRSTPGEIQYFFRHQVKDTRVAGKTYLFYMARVNWYSSHPDQFAYGDAVQIWCNNFDIFGSACFIPIQRFQSRIVTTAGTHNREKVLVVSTLPGD